MSQIAALCRNKVQAELKEEIELCHDKEFFCRDTDKEVCEEDCRNTVNSVVTLMKANGSETLLHQSLLYRNIKE